MGYALAGLLYVLGCIHTYGMWNAAAEQEDGSIDTEGRLITVLCWPLFTVIYLHRHVMEDDR